MSEKRTRALEGAAVVSQNYRWSPKPLPYEPDPPSPVAVPITIPRTNDGPKPVILDHRGERIMPKPIGFRR